MRLLIAFALLAPISSFAQVYKCVENGKTIYAERPCGPSSKALEIDTQVSEERVRQANDVAKRERRLVGEFDIKNRLDDLERNQKTVSAKVDRDSKKSRCDNLLRTAKDAKDESNMWRYHQGLIDDAKRRQKEAEDAHFSECYGRNY